MEIYKLSYKKKFLIILFIFSISFFQSAKKTNAFVFVDPANLTQNTISAISEPVTSFGTQPIIAASQIVTTAKETVGDGLAYVIAKQILRGITAQTVNWINSGFKGSPAFITNPERFFRDQADLQLEYILGEKLDGLCRPFALQVRLALITTYLQEARPPACTFDKIRANFENFGDDITKGGWKDWFEYTQIDANNPYGAYYQSKDFIDIQIASNQETQNKQLNWGKGFLSFEKCKVTDRGWRTVTEANPDADYEDAERGSNPTKGQTDGSGNPFYDENFNPIDPADIDTPSQSAQIGYDIYDPSEDYCPEDQREITTPGSIIEGQLGKVLGSGISQLEIADEVNEIADALMNQLFKRAIGGTINGLRGLSKKKTTEKRSFLEELLSKERDSLGTQQDVDNIERIDNSIPPGLDEVIRPVTTEDGTVTTDVTDIRDIKPGNYIDPNEIDQMVDDEIAKNSLKYNISLQNNYNIILQNNQTTTNNPSCNIDGTLSDGSGTPCTP